MEGWQRRAGTPKDAPPTLDSYERATGTGDNGRMPPLQRLARQPRAPGDWSSGAHDRAQRLWDLANRLREQGHVRFEPRGSGEEEDVAVYPDVGVTPGEDRKMRRGFRWLDDQKARQQGRAWPGPDEAPDAAGD